MSVGVGILPSNDSAGVNNFSNFGLSGEQLAAKQSTDQLQALLNIANDRYPGLFDTIYKATGFDPYGQASKTQGYLQQAADLEKNRIMESVSNKLWGPNSPYAALDHKYRQMPDSSVHFQDQAAQTQMLADTVSNQQSQVASGMLQALAQIWNQASQMDMSGRATTQSGVLGLMNPLLQLAMSGAKASGGGGGGGGMAGLGGGSSAMSMLPDQGGHSTSSQLIDTVYSPNTAAILGYPDSIYQHQVVTPGTEEYQNASDYRNNWADHTNALFNDPYYQSGYSPNGVSSGYTYTNNDVPSYNAPGPTWGYGLGNPDSL